MNWTGTKRRIFILNSQIQFDRLNSALKCACDLSFPCRERDWKASSLWDTGDNLNQTHTRETELLVSTTQHCLVCNNDRQITSTLCVSKPLHAYICVLVYVRAPYTVKELVRGHSLPKCHPTSIQPPAHAHTHIFRLSTQTNHSFRVFYEVSMGR